MKQNKNKHKQTHDVTDCIATYRAGPNVVVFFGLSIMHHIPSLEDFQYYVSYTVSC